MILVFRLLVVIPIRVPAVLCTKSIGVFVLNWYLGWPGSSIYDQDRIFKIEPLKPNK